MLRLMRKHATSWIIKIIFGIIVIVFVFWGMGSFTSKNSNRIAVVDGEPISAEQYRTAYNNLMEQYRRSFGDNLSEEMLRMLQVKKKAVDMLIEQKVLLNEAKRLNLKVSNDELEKAVKDFGAFQRAGKFDIQRYHRVLSSNRMTPEGFENMQREAMLIEKLRFSITDGVKVAEAEAREWFNWDQAMVNIDIATFAPEKYDIAAPTDEEMQAFFEENKSRYKTKPKINVRYLHFNPNAYRSKVKVGDEQMKMYYEEHADKYNTPKTVEARHILIRVDEGASPETVDAKKKEALNILNIAKGGEDFSDLAKKYSEGPSKDNGGYLGKFEKKSMVKSFSDKAFSMKAGEISEPVLTKFGWHLIKVEKIHEASTQSYDSVEDNIRKTLINEKAKVMASDEAESVFDISIEGDDLIKASKERGITFKTTGFFTQQKPYKAVKDRVKFASTAFGLPVMEISKVHDFGDGYYILQVVEKTPAVIPDLKDVKPDVTADLKKEKQDAKAAEEAAKFLADLKNSETTEEKNKKQNIELVSTGFFKRTDSIPKVGMERKINEAAFLLNNTNKLIDAPVKGKNAYYVFGFKERKSPSKEAFENEKTKITTRLMEQKETKLFDAWVAQLKDSCDITMNDEFFK